MCTLQNPIRTKGCSLMYVCLRGRGPYLARKHGSDPALALAICVCFCLFSLVNPAMIADTQSLHQPVLPVVRIVHQPSLSFYCNIIPPLILLFCQWYYFLPSDSIILPVILLFCQWYYFPPSDTIIRSDRISIHQRFCHGLCLWIDMSEITQNQI